jgi:hypothetical protein
MYLIVCLVAILFPFLPTSRRIYRGSAADISVLGIPLVSISGGLGTILYAVALYYELHVSGLGYNTRSNIILTGLTFIVPVILYFPIRRFRASQGINLAAATRELPPD